jgi:hypothetical protein
MMQLVLPLLLLEPEQQRLLNLERENTSSYQEDHALRTEPRRLRSMGLVKRHAGRNIGDVKDDIKVHLSDYVFLTPVAKEWAKIIEKIRRTLKQDGRERIRSPISNTDILWKTTRHLSLPSSGGFGLSMMT